MLVGITGDTHNNLKNISKICKLFNEVKPQLVIHTGDITLPKSLEAFSELNMPFVGVFGNNDQEEKEGLIAASEKFNCSLFEEPYLLNIKEKKIYILHHPDLINKNMSIKGDFIVHGHTHRYRSEIINNSLIFNPGECAGFLEGKNKIGLLDLEKKISNTISF